jgi:hypothetical protein
VTDNPVTARDLRTMSLAFSISEADDELLVQALALMYLKGCTCAGATSLKHNPLLVTRVEREVEWARTRLELIEKLFEGVAVARAEARDGARPTTAEEVATGIAADLTHYVRSHGLSLKKVLATAAFMHEDDLGDLRAQEVE